MAARKKYDVIIAGNGITGLSTAIHLQRAGISNIAICTSESHKPGSQKPPSLFSGGQVDNFTRFSHNYGNEIARQLWEFGDLAYFQLTKYCKEAGIGLQTGPKLRLITSKTELREAETAVNQLKNAGLQAKLSEPTNFLNDFLSGQFTDRVIAVQTDGAGAAFVDAKHLLKDLADASTADSIGRLRSYKQHGSNLVVHSGQDSYETEMLVLACHLAIGDYLPEMKDALVSVADQWSMFDVLSRTNLKKTFVYSANHTYEWGGVSADGKIVTGGGRYLRKHAGIEAETAVFEDKIEKHLIGQFESTFEGVKPGLRLSGTASLDCRPCDELPIIGPMFGNSRVLVATGYMGNGLALGFYAGQCLTELIAKGTSEKCPRKLHPERLRSLES